jgi:hypothetical protein
MKRTVIVAGALIGVLATYSLVVRRWHLRWGATDGEVLETLPGDDLIADPDLVSTRAISIDAGADRVWPWLAQLGQGRGGFYSYDVLENVIARCGIHSADRIVPEWQTIEVGDSVRLHPDVALEVVVVDPGRALVLRGGVPITKAEAASAKAPFDFTWTFVVHDARGGGTRLVMRERYDYTHAWVRAMVEPVEAASFVMSQKMLRGIRDRAER